VVSLYFSVTYSFDCTVAWGRLSP